MAEGRHHHPVIRCYNHVPAAKVDADLYRRLSDSASENLIREFTVPKCSGYAWELKAGQVCRFIVSEGPQVGDVNFWNLHNPREHFYSGKTRQIHGSHLTEGDRLWSCLPFLNPMATITKDSMKDYVDPDGLGIHDVIGTRCDPYTYRLVTGHDTQSTCHQNIVAAIRPHNLDESAAHDVWNIFMCTGFVGREYVCRGTPARKGDCLEIVAEMDLLVALSACPHGDVSTPCGEKVPDEKCHGLGVEIREASEEVVAEWRASKM